MNSANLGEEEPKKGFGTDLVTLKQRGIEEWDINLKKKKSLDIEDTPPLFLNGIYRDDEAGMWSWRCVMVNSLLSICREKMNSCIREFICLIHSL